MAIEARKKEGQTAATMLYEFNKKARQSGLVKETRRRQFKARKVNKRTKRLAALYREKKAKEFERLKKFGKASSGTYGKIKGRI